MLQLLIDKGELMSKEFIFMIAWVIGFYTMLGGFAYIWFRDSVKNKLSINHIKVLFRSALLITLGAEISTFFVALILSYFLPLGNTPFYLVIAAYPLLLACTLYAGIPSHIRRHIKFTRQLKSDPLHFEEYEELLDTNPSSLDPANPNGLMNPISPNYLYRYD